MLFYIKKILIHICLFSLLLGFSCSDDTLGEGSEINISDEFSIDLYQSLDVNSPGLILELSTFEEYDCSNYTIAASQVGTSDSIKIRFDNILAPEICEEGQGPATQQLLLALNNQPSQDIRFEFNEVIFDDALLIDDGSSFVLELKSNHGIKSYISRLNKIPSNSLICLFQYDQLNFASEIDSNIEILTNLIPETSLPNGYYGHFIIEDDRIVSKSNQFANSRGIYFDLSTINESTKNEFLILLEEIEENLDSNIGLYIYEQIL